MQFELQRPQAFQVMSMTLNERLAAGVKLPDAAELSLISSKVLTGAPLATCAWRWCPVLGRARMLPTPAYVNTHAYSHAAAHNRCAAVLSKPLLYTPLLMWDSRA